MTQGLLISRGTKNKLHATAVSVPTVANVNRYKTYKTIYLRLIRAAKKLFISSKLTENASNPKKTWQILNEILGRKVKTDTVSQINANGVTLTENLQVANRFNSFFTNAGKHISDSVQPILKKPEDFINYGREIPPLQLTNTTPEHVMKIIKNFKP
jgi:hypothetical protein